jgi:DNA repair photolyase
MFDSVLRPVRNPPNPWRTRHVEWLGPPPRAELVIYEERARSILSENESPDVGFRFSLNPYRGCAHACAYCYARPFHQYLDFGAGTDFDRKIVVKVNAPELLRKAFLRPSWTGECIAFSGATDCYQPLEASYRLTRRCLELCRDFRNPVGIVTKSLLVRRDADVLLALAEVARVRVSLSIPFSDDDMARRIEPGAPPPSARFRVLRDLATAGLEVGVGVAPIVPGLNDDQVPEILARAADAGARTAFRLPLRLPAEVVDVFLPALAEAYPHRANKVEAAIREMRGGRLNDPRFGRRFEAGGDRWRAIEELFSLTCRRVGLEDVHRSYGPEREPAGETTFRCPRSQLTLW